MRRKIAAAAGVIFASLLSFQAFAAGYWYQLSDGTWRYKNEAGEDVTDFQLINGKWYYFNTAEAGKGNMIIGLHSIGNKICYLNPDDGGAMLMNADYGVYHFDKYGNAVSDIGNPYLKSTEAQEFTSAYKLETRIPLDTAVDLATGVSKAGNTSSGNNVITAGGNNNTVSAGSSGYASDDSVKHGSNDPDYGNYSRLTADQRAAMNNKINEFKNKYLSDGMSDFDKEIMIIRWLVENSTYAYGNPTAYNCIVEDKAQCAGYADAFLQTAKACGLTVKYVMSDTHAWNMINLDGDWYHVDVTGESSSGHGAYGFGRLWNNYINLTDAEIKQHQYHESWNVPLKANGTKYGRSFVTEYLKDESNDTKQYSEYEQKKAAEKATPHAYTIHFVDKETGAELSVQSGSSIYNERVKYELPGNYIPVVKDKFKIGSGKATFGRFSFQNYGMTDLDATVYLYLPAGKSK